MVPACRIAAVAALGLTLTAGTAPSAWAAPPQSKAPSRPCEQAVGLAVLTSPLVPSKGAPLRVVFAAEQAMQGELSLVGPDGTVAAASRERRGGPPYFWSAEVVAPATGTWHAKLVRDGETGFTIPDQEPEALCEKLSWLLNDKELHATMSKRAVEYAQDYAWEKIAKQIVDVYEGLGKI